MCTFFRFTFFSCRFLMTTFFTSSFFTAINCSFIICSFFICLTCTSIMSTFFSYMTCTFFSPLSITITVFLASLICLIKPAISSFKDIILRLFLLIFFHPSSKCRIKTVIHFFSCFFTSAHMDQIQCRTDDGILLITRRKVPFKLYL
ncbi:hypothetical protein V8G54_032085 [Vigna mungo]|uniref:Uncharacterized protein n=1 Tax=Vigna mungo TaxID=3915 RepID=A0AAQ3RHI8_VIGMU